MPCRWWPYEQIFLAFSLTSLQIWLINKNILCSLKVSHKGTAKNLLFCFSGAFGLPADPGGFVNICGHFSVCLIPLIALKTAHEKVFEWPIYFHLYFLLLVNCLEDNNSCVESAQKSIWFNVLFMLNRNSFYFFIMPLNQTISSEVFLQDLVISFSWIPNNSVLLWTLLHHCSPFTDYLWIFICPNTEPYLMVMTKLCGTVPTWWSEGMSSRETLTGLRGGPVRTSWGSTRPSERSCIWAKAQIQAGWRLDWKHPWREGP